VGHFVTEEQLKAYKADEIVPDPGTGKPKCYPKGSFIYRLAGRDREKSASYYTPESLTQCLVKYALKELLPGKTAADILQLKVCEPAMGSAAFLNEVVNQLAQKYLELRQQETGKSIPHEQFATELQKVKMRLADQNVFGVDLNPVAVELAEVSLWLNSIFTPENGRAFVGFSQQLVCGNSLIGARRQIYRVNQLPTGSGRKAKPSKLWHEHAPEELAWDAELPKDAIFHFLLPDPGMAAYKDKVIKELEPEAIERCQRWNKAFVDEVFRESQIAHLLRLSKLVDDLWKAWAEQQGQLRQRTTDPLPVWEDPTGAKEGDWTPLRLKDRIQEQEVLGREVANTNARLRLKWAMDYWVALWFWPIRQAGSLPSRDTWLLELSMILGDLEQGVSPEPGQGNLFADTQPKQLAVDFSNRHGFVDVEKLKSEFERLTLIEMVAQQNRPLHWDLEFSDILLGGGYDIVVGNPPWQKVQFDYIRTASDWQPLLGIRDHGAKEQAGIFNESMLQQNKKELLLVEYSEQSGTQSYLNAKCNYELLSGGKANLYKAFLPQAWRLSSGAQNSVTGYLHPEGVFDDKTGGTLREEIYARLRLHFQFQNETKLFPIGNRNKFSINVYSNPNETPGFAGIFNLFSAKTIDECFVVDSPQGGEIGIKSSHGAWNMAGCLDRIIIFSPDTLILAKELFDDSAINDLQAKLPSIHCKQVLRVLDIARACKGKLSRIADSYDCSVMWDETKSIRQDKIFAKETHFAAPGDIFIAQGPHIFVGNPLYQTPKQKCLTHRAYDPIAHEFIPSDYRPRTNFKPFSSEIISSRVRTLSFNKSVKFHKVYRLAARMQIGSASERSLVTALIPPGWMHTYGLISYAFTTTQNLLHAASLWHSIPYDFLVKTMGKAAFLDETASQLPFPDCSSLALFRERTIRVLMLNCITSEYSDLWEEAWQSDFVNCKWSKKDARLDSIRFEGLEPLLSSTSPSLTDFERRQLLVENDVLVAILLGISLEELIALYKIQFPVMCQYERDTWYDRNGRIVFTTSKGLAGVGFPRKGSGRGPNKTTGWEDIQHETSGTFSRTILDDTLPGGPVERTITYEAPFDRCDRVKDYRIAWEFFEKEGVA